MIDQKPIELNQMDQQLQTIDDQNAVELRTAFTPYIKQALRLKVKAEFERAAEEAKQKELAPDKEKLIAYANSFTIDNIPKLKTQEAKVAIGEFINTVESAIAQLKKNCVNL